MELVVDCMFEKGRYRLLNIHFTAFLTTHFVSICALTLHFIVSMTTILSGHILYGEIPF